jgi:hypothetical protein
MTLIGTCRDPAATEDRFLVFDAFGPIGFVDEVRGRNPRCFIA